MTKEHNDHEYPEIEEILKRAEKYNQTSNKDGRWQVDYKDDGVYLTVFPPQNGGQACKPSDVLNGLNELRIENMDTRVVFQITNDMAGNPTYIAPPQQEALEDGSVIIELSGDNMEAFVTVKSPRGGGRAMTTQDIEKGLQEKNVVFGVIDKIKEVAIKNINKKLLVARGLKPVDGVDAYIEFKKQTEGKVGKPKELLNGNVDFYNLNLIQNVEPGEVLAVKKKAKPGTPGRKVTGEPIPAKPGKDIQLIPGQNVELRDDNCTAVATKSGHVLRDGNKISVSSVYVIDGDVGFNTGNIEFNGSVIVKGSVNEGFKVIADGEVEVMNIIADGIVECTGSIKVKNGIVGRNRTHIKAGGDVLTKFIENSSVESGGNVIVGEAIMHSHVFAKKSVTVGGKGVIVGGQIRAGEEITCKIAGSSLGTATELEAGTSPELRQEYATLQIQKKEKEAELDKAEKAHKLLSGLLQSQGKLSDKQQTILDKVSETLVKLIEDRDNLNTALIEVASKIEQSENGKINVQGTLYPGVKAMIGSSMMFIRDRYSFVTLNKAGVDIKISPFSG